MGTIRAAESPMRQLALETLSVAVDESAPMVEHGARARAGRRPGPVPPPHARRRTAAAIHSRAEGGRGRHQVPGRVVVVEAVQINTPCNTPDYVYARRVALLPHADGGAEEDLLEETLAQAPRRGDVASRSPLKGAIHA